MQNECLFCGIVTGTVPSHTIWEDDEHLAFLTIFPNTEGASVVIPKAHYPSYAFDLPDEVLTKLMLAVKTVAKKIDATFDDVGRTALVFEGMAINHVHAKLFPLHGTKSETWEPRHLGGTKYFEKYEGYVSSQDAERMDDAILAATAKRIRETT